jgi:putative ABC transport system permease protein
MRRLLRLYPADFRDEMGDALVETYRDRRHAAARDGGAPALAGVWLRALLDSVVNGFGERLRPAVAWRRGGNWGRDTERALRRLTRAPVFTLTMLATLTVGLGAFAMVYAVVHKVLLAPLPYERPGDLYFVWRDYGTVLDLRYGAVSGTDVVALQGARTVIQDAVAIDAGRLTLARAGSPGDDAAPEEIRVFATSPNLFAMLGVQPLLGRTFAADEVGVGRPALVVLGHDLWRDRFGGARTVIGADVLLNGVPHRVIGVMGPEFRFLNHGGLGAPVGADAYVTHPIDLAQTEPRAGSYSALIRARPGVAPEAVDAAVRAVGKAVDERDFGGRGITLWPVGLEADLLDRVRPPLLVLGAAGVLLVLVLAVNMATLLLVRAMQRDQEFAISRALGANGIALARATLLEAALLGLLGGAGGALVAVWGTRALVALAPADLPRRETIAVDWPVAAVVVGVGTLLGLLAGALPALWATRARLATLLRDAAVRGGGGGHGAMRRAMVVVQVALAVVLLSAGGLVVRSFDRLLRADPGFDAADVLTLRVPVPAQRYPESADVNALHERLTRELAAIPGVTSVGATTALPFDGATNQTDVDFPGAPGNTGDEDEDSPFVDAVPVLPGYFETLGIRVHAGRTFGAAAPAGVREAVIDRTLASRFFPRGGAVGARMQFRGDSLVVVGVVEHARQYDVHQDGRPQVYVRNADYTEATISFALRSGRPPAALVSDVRAAVGRVDRQLALAEVRPMEEYVRDALRQPRLSAVLLSGFSAGALLLAAMGLYGVIAGAVSRRRHELAVRLALGADRRGVLRLVLREGAGLVLLGLVLGVPGVLVAGRLVGGVLVGVSPFDPGTLAAVAGLLAAVALAACWLPARRAADIEPARLLRQG